jgi:transcriptional regulator with XRE-family HTH domain
MRARKVVSWNIRRLRVEKGLSQEALAGDAEIGRAYISGIERQSRNPSVDVLEKVANTLGVPLMELFREPERGDRAPQPLPRGRKRGRRN